MLKVSLRNFMMWLTDIIWSVPPLASDVTSLTQHETALLLFNSLHCCFLMNLSTPLQFCTRAPSYRQQLKCTCIRVILRNSLCRLSPIFQNIFKNLCPSS